MKKCFLFVFFILFLFPFLCRAEEYIPNGKEGILIEAGSGKVLYEKNCHERVSVASLTKMVAQIIVLEEIESGNIHWNDIVTVSRNASGMGGSQIYIEEGEKISVRDLMKGISVASGNDATVAMAEYISGSEEKFVVRMNEVVKRLGLKDTHFINCTGLDEENHYSSSYDMAMIARELIINHPMILEFSSIYEDYLRENTDHKFWLVNTNKLIRFYDGADGLKTGHTDAAGYCLAATAKRNSLRLIAVVLGEDDSKVRNKEVMELLDYGFSSVQINCLKKKNEIVSNITLEMADQENVPVILKDDLCVIEDKGDEKKYDYDIQITKRNLPVKKQEDVGQIKVLLNGKVVGSGELQVSRNISKQKFLVFFRNTIKNLISGVL